MSALVGKRPSGDATADGANVPFDPSKPSVTPVEAAFTAALQSSNGLVRVSVALRKTSAEIDAARAEGIAWPVIAASLSRARQNLGFGPISADSLRGRIGRDKRNTHRPRPSSERPERESVAIASLITPSATQAKRSTGPPPHSSDQFRRLARARQQIQDD
jgi:hypothetical protein